MSEGMWWEAGSLSDARKCLHKNSITVSSDIFLNSKGEETFIYSKDNSTLKNLD